MKKIYKFCLVFLIVFGINSCTDPFDLEGEIESVDSILVVEAMITNELSQHEVLLSRTFALNTEDDEPPLFEDQTTRSPETNANVRVVDDLQNEFVFQETAEGTYVSTTPFSAAQARTYQLLITTSDGEAYTSAIEEVPAVTSQIENITATLGVNDDGEEGVRITVSSFDPVGNSRFYRYEYEETFRLTAPFWSPLEAVILSENPPDVVTRFKTGIQDQICYPTNLSQEIFLSNSTNLNEDRVTDFEVRFVERSDNVIADRYSILVRQFTQSPEAHDFYITLQQFSNSETIFSQTQPGFITGNITSADGESSNVLGFFEVASITEERIFFNRDEFFPTGQLPDFPFGPCEPELVFLNGPGGRSPLIEMLQTGFVFFTFPQEFSPSGNLIIVPGPCGDCTFFGTNIVPDFWVD